MSVDKVELLVENEDLRKRLAKSQRLWIDSMNDHIETQAQLMLAQWEILRLEFGEDLEKDQPELYKSVKSKADGSWLLKEDEAEL